MGYGIGPTNGRIAQVSCVALCSFPLALDHAAGVESLIWVTFGASKRVNTFFK